jgi:hypothetical protein
MRTASLILSLAAALTFTGAAMSAPPPAQPVVVELFTSQGCSSCPPADAALALVADRADVIALSFGVTYWDDLGWRDTFAKSQFTDRQWAYARGLKHDNVATPQVVINGRTDVVGQSVAEIDAGLRRARIAAGPQLTLTAAGVSIAGAAPAKAADVWLVRYNPAVQQVPVKRGENTGKTLPIKNVVRELTHLGAWSGGAKTYAIPAGPAGLSTAVLIQAGPGGPILAAAKS